ncbi:NEAT domain-containing protein [Paenibacillus sp. y28]|uniref:NEAT domain-containing protein n=1 Tax=Paenibacillus sp. y28 TaxID=3129110 RepID=UPI003015B4B2
MKQHVKKSLAAWLSAAIFLSSLLSALNIGVRTAEAAVTVPDGEYSVNYRYVKESTMDSSAANPYLYVINSGKLIVNNGVMQFEHEVTPKYWGYFDYIGFRKPGASKAVITDTTKPPATGTEGYQALPVRSADNGSGSLITTIDVENIKEYPDILMHIVIKNSPDYGENFEYDHWYNVRLVIDTSTLPLIGDDDDDGENGGSGSEPITLQALQGLVTVVQTVYSDTYEGTELGEYPAGSKQPLYLHLQEAEAFLASGNTTDTSLVIAVYNQLLAALNTYQSLMYSADKSILSGLIVVVQAFVDSMVDFGETEGKLGYTYAPVTPGEFSQGTKGYLVDRIAQSEAVVANTKATQAVVDKAVYDLATYYNSYKNYYYIASEPQKLIVLDSLSSTTVPSSNFPEILDTTVFIQNYGSSDAWLANIAFDGQASISEVLQSTPSANGSFSISGLTYSNEYYHAQAVTKQTNAEQQVYQAKITRSITTQYLPKWQGFSYLKYKLDNETKEVYLSYNAPLLEALNSAADEARLLLDASMASGDDQAFETAKTELQSKIDAARTTAANLASTRPQITTADTNLQTALTSFKAAAAYPLYFSAVHAAQDEFSTADSYFVKPATISAVDGELYATMTVNDSSAITEFQVKSGGTYVDSTVVSEDSAANTRVIKFPVDSLSALIDAKVHIVIPEQSYDYTHDIRLNFNGVDNRELSQAFAEAAAFNRTAVAGTEPGQYPAAAKTALQTAMAAAGAEASRLDGTSEQSAAALQAIQQALITFKASVIVETPEELADGDYTIPYTIYKKGTSDPSVMYDYVDKNSGKLTVSGGKNYVSLSLKQSAEIKSFKTEVNGALTETETVSEDTAANTRTVRFEVPDLDSRLNGWVKIYWVLPEPIGLYDHEYDVELGFGTPVPVVVAVDKTELASQIATAEAKLAAAVEGTAAGQYIAGSKATLQTAINEAEAVATSAVATQEQVDAAAAALKKSVSSFLASVILANANYSFNLPDTIKDGSGTPLLNFISPQASFNVSGGKQMATVKLLAGVTFKKVQLKQADGTLVDLDVTTEAKQAGIVRVLSTDSSTTAVTFEVADRTAVYVLGLLDSAQTERTFEIDFPELTLVAVTDSSSGSGKSRSGGSSSSAAAAKTLAETLEAGSYSISYTLLSKGTAQASAASEFVKQPAKLEVKDGKSYVVLTLAHDEVVSLKIAGTDGAWTDAETVSVNSNSNERIVRFPIQYATTKVTAQFVLAASGKAAVTHEAEFSFDSSSLQAEAAQPSDNGQTETPGQQPSAGGSLLDLQSHWAKAKIERAVELGIVNGYEDGSFRPDASINRAEFTTLLSKALKLEQGAGALSFSDEDSIPAWVKPYLAPVVQAGIIGGYEDGSFRADRAISRAELAVMIVRALSLDVDASAVSAFADASSIPQWAQAEVSAAYKLGMINGRDNNLFAPNESATRAEAVSLILALYDAVQK